MPENDLLIKFDIIITWLGLQAEVMTVAFTRQVEINFQSLLDAATFKF